jgi:long-chain fatty acid transport protein
LLSIKPVNRQPIVDYDHHGRISTVLSWPSIWIKSRVDMPVYKCTLASALTSVVLIGTASLANAGGFSIHTQSTTAMSLSFAGAASGSGGLSSTFWNPATITMSPGWQGEFHASAAILQSRIDPLRPTPTLTLGGSGDIGQDALIPALYSSYQWNDRVWFGVTTNSPFGLVTKPNDEWAGQVYSRSSKLFTVSVNPIVGIKVTDWLSLGAGPTIEFADTRLKRALAITPSAPNVVLQGDDIGIGLTAGLTLMPWDTTTIGIGFRSSITHRFDGDLRSPGLTLPTKTSLMTPETVAIGITQRVTSDLTLHGGFEWTNWTRLGAPDIVGPIGVVGNLPFNWKDSILISFGAEYTLRPQLVVRAGIAYDEVPVTNGTRATRLPDSDRFWASVGATFKWSEQLSFDLGYSHVFYRNAQIAILPGHQEFAGLPFVADVDSSVDIVSLAVKYKFADRAAPMRSRFNMRTAD